jgi:hypothetical protein
MCKAEKTPGQLSLASDSPISMGETAKPHSAALTEGGMDGGREREGDTSKVYS